MTPQEKADNIVKKFSLIRYERDKVKIKFPITFASERLIRQRVLDEFGLEMNHNQFILLATVNVLEMFLEGVEYKIPAYYIEGAVAGSECLDNMSYSGKEIGKALKSVKDMNLLESEVKVTLGRNYNHWKCTPLGNALIAAYREAMWDFNGKVVTTRRLKKYYTRTRREYLKNKSIKNKYRRMVQKKRRK